MGSPILNDDEALRGMTPEELAIWLACVEDMTYGMTYKDGRLYDGDGNLIHDYNKVDKDETNINV